MQDTSYNLPWVSFCMSTFKRAVFFKKLRWLLLQETIIWKF